MKCWEKETRWGWTGPPYSILPIYVFRVAIFFGYIAACIHTNTNTTQWNMTISTKTVRWERKLDIRSSCIRQGKFPFSILR